jgi:hypothetical protein
MTEQTDNVKNVLDFVAVFTAIGSFLQILTPVFGLIGAIVGVMRIYEMATGKEFYTLWRKKRDEDAKQD